MTPRIRAETARHAAIVGAVGLGVVFGLIALDGLLIASSVARRFGVDLTMREILTDRVTWQRRLAAARGLAMDAAEVRLWIEAGRPSDWKFDPSDPLAVDEDAERWVLDWLDSDPENVRRLESWVSRR